MTTTAHPSLPIISIAPYVDRSKSSDADRNATASALHVACRDYGFFYLDITSFAQSDQIEELLGLAREFFALPQAEKDRISIRNQDQARGGKADNHEAIDLYAPVENPDKTKPLWGENQWPAAVPDFQNKFEGWISKMKELGLLVMEAMADGLGMARDEWSGLRGCIDNSFWVMRIIGYPPLPNDHDGFSCGAHKDYGCLTFLYADPTPDALQVFVPRSVEQALKSQPVEQPANVLPKEEGTSEGSWIYANPIPGCIVCNIGEMWEVWTRGTYKSTLHRVIHRSSNYRVSLPFFFEPNFNALIKPLEATIREQERTGITMDDALYTPVVYGDFLKKKVGSNFAIDDGKANGRY
ncbi:hypothetical protein FRB94_010991 [Tulasnella sp. JGI-2019a]|nr:hypothetical protein FRB94_010991 [Tulasnella sp. JGI-2019a]KAG9035883.1 hypothetical protein FRB95_010286 [Tulasnella sp. JGI-2019a]